MNVEHCLDFQREETRRLRAKLDPLEKFAEAVASELHGELCNCGQCLRALRAFEALGKEKPKRQNWLGISGEDLE